MVKDWMAELKEFMDMAGRVPTPFDAPEVREAKIQAVIDEDLDPQRIIKFAKQLLALSEKEQDDE